MILRCPKCKKQYNVDGSRITEAGVKITCPACQHQFIVRKKLEEEAGAPAKKPEPKRPKTPPCAVCGEPSTHIFRGPPPRPLCEHHFRIEQEKESRFFEEEDFGSPAESPANIPDPDITKPPVSPPRDATHPTPPPATAIFPPPSMSPLSPPTAEKTAMPPSVSEPVFESFDDDFELFDSEEKRRGPSPKTHEPATASPKKEEETESFLADAHEFLMPGAGLVPATTSDKEAPVISEAPPKFEDDLDSFSFEEPAKSSHPMEKPALFSPEDFASPKSETAPPPPGGARDMAEEFKAMGRMNLDGSGTHAPAEEAEESFEWEASFSPSPSSARDSLDLEMEKRSSLEIEPSPRPAPLPEKRVITPPPKVYKIEKPREATSGFVALGALLLGILVLSFLSLTGVLYGAPSTETELHFSPLVWEGALAGELSEESPLPSSASLPSLNLPSPEPRSGGKEGEKHGDKALQLMLTDTAENLELAEEEIKKSLALAPKNPALLCLQIDLLAFRETLEEKGSRGESAGQVLANLPAEIKSDPLLARAKAHVWLLEKKTMAAQSLLMEYLKEHSRDAIAHYLLGISYLEQPTPDLERAAASLEKAISLEKNFIRAYWDLARIYRQMKKYDMAMAQYEEILRRSPNRKGIEAAMEETSREKSLGRTSVAAPSASPTPSSSPPSAPPTASGPSSLRETGNAISNNLVEAIQDAAAEISTLNLAPPGRPAPTSSPFHPSGQPPISGTPYHPALPPEELPPEERPPQ